MTSVVIVADSGHEMARLTASVKAVRGLEIVRHANGRTPLGRLAAAHRPSVVVIGEMSPRNLTFDRVREVRAASPESAVVVVAAAAGARWLARALEAGAAAALPGESATALGAIVEEVLATDHDCATPTALAA